jgi:hypothetical protein
MIHSTGRNPNSENNIISSIMQKQMQKVKSSATRHRKTDSESEGSA